MDIHSRAREQKKIHELKTPEAKINPHQDIIDLASDQAEVRGRYAAALLETCSDLSNLFARMCHLVDEDDWRNGLTTKIQGAIKAIEAARQQQLNTRRMAVPMKDPHADSDGPDTRRHIYIDACVDETDAFRSGLDWAQAFFTTLQDSERFNSPLKGLSPVNQQKVLQGYYEAWQTFQEKITTLERQRPIQVSAHKYQKQSPPTDQAISVLKKAVTASSHFHQRLQDLVILADTAEGNKQLASKYGCKAWLQGKSNAKKSVAPRDVKSERMPKPGSAKKKSKSVAELRRYAGKNLFWLRGLIVSREQANVKIVAARLGENKRE